MADVAVEIGGFSYTVACRDGEEPHLRAISKLVDAKSAQIQQAVGNVSEVRQLLLTSLLLADELDELQKGGSGSGQGSHPAANGQTSTVIADAAEQLAARIEAIASRLENGA